MKPQTEGRREKVISSPSHILFFLFFFVFLKMPTKKSPLKMKQEINNPEMYFPGEK